MTKATGAVVQSKWGVVNKKVIQKNRKALIKKGSLRSALVADLKAKTGRKDLKFETAPKIANKTQLVVPIEKRAGYPATLPRGAVNPQNWETYMGVKVEVDFSRALWLPDTWGQGVKKTLPLTTVAVKARERNGKQMRKGGGGILTTFVAPDGKCFFHKQTSEAHFLKVEGRPMTEKDGFNGRVRMAKLQAEQQVQLARAQIKDIGNGRRPDMIGTEKDETFFRILSPSERRCLPKTTEMHFAVVSARRAKDPEGVRDIFMVQTQLVEAGATPTWYVDEDSLQDYQALGLRAVIGGRLTEARNKALQAARRQGKVCIQVSDDISAWEYREGKPAKVRTDDANNAAHAAARRYIITPVAAAKFITAKMRSADDPKPKLGGVYMLGSCARAFSANPFGRNHFILGDFFVVDLPSKVNFDPQMKLKEDYDFTCAHIKAHGSVMRCNRMTLNVKHYDNGGGACTNRDKKGEEEQRNIAILNKKWPGVFRSNPKRKNEVIMRWKNCQDPGNDSDCDDNDKVSSANSRKSGGMKLARKGVAKRSTSNAQVAALKAGVRKRFLKRAVVKPKASAMKDQQDEIEAKISLLPEASLSAKTERSFSLLMDGFRKYLLGCGLKETSTNAYLTCFSSLFLRDFRSYAASAGEEYKALIKASPQNKNTHGQFHAAVSHFRSFYQKRKCGQM